MEQERQKSILELAYIDELTGIFNRRYFYNYVPTIMAKTIEEKRFVALLMMDVDNFKNVNDTFGHLVGDSVLADIGRILKKEARESDIIARYAGDEFVVALPNANRAEAKEMAARLVKKVSDYTFEGTAGQKLIRCTLSIGISVAPEDGTEIEDLIFKADQALYSSKKAGRNRVCDSLDILPEIALNARLKTLFPPPRLLERDDVILQARNFLSKKRAKKGGMFSFKGRTGIGKTAVLDEFTRRLTKTEEADILLSDKCSEPDTIQPYYRLLDILRRYIQSLGGGAVEVIGVLSDEHRSVLAKYIPEIKELLSPLLEELPSDKQEGQLLSEAIFEILMKMTLAKRLFLAIDDMHWLDEKTLELLRQLAENDTRFISICAAYQPEQLTDSEGKPRPLSNFLKSLDAKSGYFEEAELKPLTPNGVAELIELLFPGMDAAKRLAVLIHKKTNGVPLVIEETLRSLIEAGLIYLKDKNWFCKDIRDEDIVHSLDAMILKRFTNMDEETKEILTTAALIGEGFDSKILNKVTNISESRALELMDRAKDARLISALEPLSDDRFAFTSQRVRDLIAREIGGEKFKALHQKLARVLEEEYGGTPEAVLGELVYHYKLAKDMGKVTEFIDKITYLESFPFDKVEEYFKKRLMEKEAIKIEFDETNTKFILGALASFWRAAVSVSEYPSTTPTVRMRVDEFYEDLIALFRRTETLIITEYVYDLLINGQPFRPVMHSGSIVDNVLKMMRDKLSGEITFENTFRKDELIPFLEVLMYKKKGVDFRVALTRGGVKNIRIEKARYGRIREDEEIKEKVLENIMKNYIAGNVKEISDAEMQNLRALHKKPEKIAEIISSVLNMNMKESEAKKVNIDEWIQKLSQTILDIGKLLPTATGDEWSRYKDTMEKIVKSLSGPIREFIAGAASGTDLNLIQESIRKKIDAAAEGLKTKAAELTEELIDSIDGDYMSVVDALEREGKEAIIPLIYVLRGNPIHEERYNAYLLTRVIAGVLSELGSEATQRLQGELLDDRSYVVRNAIEVIGYAKGAVSPNTIEPFLKHTEISVRDAASLALERLKGPTPL